MSMRSKEQSFNDKGRVYYAYGVTIVPAATIQRFLFKTNDTEVDLESVVIAGRTPNTTIKIYEEPTVTDAGTPFPAQSYNRRDNRGSVAKLSNSTVTVSANGTEIIAYEAFGTDAGGNKTDQSSVNVTDNNTEWQLPKNGTYLIEIENLDAILTADLNFKMQWIELNS